AWQPAPAGVAPAGVAPAGAAAARAAQAARAAPAAATPAGAAPARATPARAGPAGATRDGSTPALAVLRLLAAPVGATELVAEIHADAGGVPGASLAGPLVLALPATAAPDWLVLPVPAAVPIPAPAT